MFDGGADFWCTLIRNGEKSFGCSVLQLVFSCFHFKVFFLLSFSIKVIYIYTYIHKRTELQSVPILGLASYTLNQVDIEDFELSPKSEPSHEASLNLPFHLQPSPVKLVEEREFGSYQIHMHLSYVLATNTYESFLSQSKWPTQEA